MTGEDHNTDALVAALQSPALPAEQVGEAAAVAAMFEAQTRIPAASRAPRSRRGVAVAAVTVASLGLGGLVAAGPGIFSPAADRPDSSSMARTTVSEVLAVDAGEPGGVETTSDATETEGTGGTEGVAGRITDDPDADEQTAANERAADERAVGEQTAGEQTSEDPDVECADGNHGKTVSSVAQATESGPGKGATVSEAARSNCGQTDENAPGTSDDNPGNSGQAPGQTGDTPGNSDQAPGQGADTPANADQAPGQTGDTPANADQAPGQGADQGTTGGAPGQSDEAPGNSGKNKP